MDNKFIFYTKQGKNTGYSSLFNTLLSFSSDIGCIPMSTNNIGKKISTVQNVILPDDIVENFFNIDPDNFVDVFEQAINTKLDISNTTISKSKYKHFLPFAIPIKFAKQYNNYYYIDQSSQRHLDTYDRLISERQIDFMRLNEETSMFFCTQVLDKDILKFSNVLKFLKNEYGLSNDQVYNKSFDYITTLMDDAENGDTKYYENVYNQPVVYDYEIGLKTESEKLNDVINIKWFFKKYSISLDYYMQVCEKLDIQPNKEMFTNLYDNFISKDKYDQLVLLTGNTITAQAIIDRLENDC